MAVSLTEMAALVPPELVLPSDHVGEQTVESKNNDSRIGYFGIVGALLVFFIAYFLGYYSWVWEFFGTYFPGWTNELNAENRRWLAILFKLRHSCEHNNSRIAKVILGIIYVLILIVPCGPFLLGWFLGLGIYRACTVEDKHEDRH